MTAWGIGLVWLGCVQRPPPLPEPLPTAPHAAAEAAAAARVADPRRGGPPVHPGASPLPPFTGVDRGSARYVGVDTCAACHPGEAARWAQTAHAHSLATLEDAGRAHDPRCLRCHTTGLGHPGGFGEAPPEVALAEVGCEACHGPGSGHAGAPGPGYGRLAPDGGACVGCHTHDQSPSFRWETHWPQIAHPLTRR